jgi:hypothetical protein
VGDGVASTGVVFQRADLSQGLSAAEVRRQAVWWRWRLAAAVGRFHPQRPRVNRWASMYRCICELRRVLRLVLLISGQVEGSLSARPSRYWRLQPELWFIMFFVNGPALGGASGESLSQC